MAVKLTEEQLEEMASALVFKWVFPTDATAAPDDHTTAQAYLLQHMLLKRMKQLAAAGTDPTGMLISDLLPGLKPEEIIVDENFI